MHENRDFRAISGQFFSAMDWMISHVRPVLGDLADDSRVMVLADLERDDAVAIVLPADPGSDVPPRAVRLGAIALIVALEVVGTTSAPYGADGASALLTAQESPGGRVWHATATSIPPDIDDAAFARAWQQFQAQAR